MLLLQVYATCQNLPNYFGLLGINLNIPLYVCMYIVHINN